MEEKYLPDLSVDAASTSEGRMRTETIRPQLMPCIAERVSDRDD